MEQKLPRKYTSSIERKLVCGVGINDADYTFRITTRAWTDDSGVEHKATYWSCPMYLAWRNMIMRCHSKTFQAKNPTYLGCSVCEEWLRFSNFKAWMEQQDWQGKELDKDLLVLGNKVYSPETCMFISSNINSFLNMNSKNRDKVPLGVQKAYNGFVAWCRNPLEKKAEYLGLHKTSTEAHHVWLKRKQEFALMLADTQTDERLAKSLKEISEVFLKVYNEGGVFTGFTLKEEVK